MTDQVNTPSRWDFLKSPAFWALTIGAVALWLFQDGIISEGLRNCIVTISGGFVTIRTVDRITDKMTAP